MSRRENTSGTESTSDARRDFDLLDYVADGLLVLDQDGHVLQSNPQLTTLLSLTTENITGRHIDDLFILRSTDNNVLENVNWERWSGHAFKSSLCSLTTTAQKEVTVRVSLGSDEKRYGTGTRWMLLRDASLEIHAGNDPSLVDNVTGIMNRRGFETELNKLITQSKLADKSHIVFYIDINQFKVINATSGHEAGDKVLRQIARNIKERLRGDDLVVRLGNDEYGVLLKDCPLAAAQRIAQTLHDQFLSWKFTWDDKQFDVNVSIGIAQVQSGKTFQQILADAESACFVAKAKVKSRLHVYSADDNNITRQNNDLRWIQIIKNALVHDNFCLFVQKILPLGSSGENLAHNEILVRMLGDTGTIISPMEFIPVAEQYGLMRDIDRWVVTNTFKMIKTNHIDKQLEYGKYSINLSGQSVSDEDTLTFIEQQFDVFGADPEKICFEITETTAIENIAAAKKLMQGLQSRGCEFSLDDFGSGMSSFGYLKHLPVDYLKIDGVFVKDMANDPLDCKLVSAIHQLGQVMGIKTIAEFVESMAILHKLKELGVDYAQGYAIGKPERVEH